MTDSSCVSTLARNEELEGLLREALEALRPFNDACAHLHPAQPNDGVTLDGFKVADFRRASATSWKIHEALGEKT